MRRASRFWDELEEAAMRRASKVSIDRRTLFRYGAAGGALSAVSGLLPAGHSALAQAGAAPDRSEPFELEELTFGAFQKRMETGAETARSITQKYLSRIASLDRRGPELCSILEVNPDALSIADSLDGERRAGHVRGPLHGIPILLKDNIGTADRMTTTAGSLALEGSVPSADSAVARRLREAGAILLGKTNMSEWANFRSTHSTSGWSGRGGQCRNPYALDRNPSGSSSGSGSATAANFAAAAIGSETDGSVVSPSNNCGLVGIKPTVGLVSRAGIIPIAHSQDTAGPMARTVSDAAALLAALAGPDVADAATREAAGRPGFDLARALSGGRLEGIRIGVPRKGLFGQSPPADQIVEGVIADLRRLGAEIVDPADIETMGEVDKTELEVLLYEFKADLPAYLAALPGAPGARPRTFADLIAFNEKERAREMPFFGQELFLQADKKGPLTEKAYRDALETNHRLTRKEGIDRTMDRYKLDALIAPTSGPAGLIDLVDGDYGPGGSSTFPAVAGYPDVTVPAGFAFGLPVGVSFFGRAWSETILIRIAFAYEQATRHRRAPKFLPTASLALA
jgi:amidase